MIDTVKLNNMVRDDAPIDKLIDACAEIDIFSCFDMVYEPPIDFIETECVGEEKLSDKVKRLIFSDKGVVCS